VAAVCAPVRAAQGYGVDRPERRLTSHRAAPRPRASAAAPPRRPAPCPQAAGSLRAGREGA
jgi:hypothetical protein